MKSQFAVAICSALIAFAALSSPSFAQQKTVRACQEEWRANKAANEAAGITQKAYVEKCRAASAAAKPATKPAAKPEAKPAAKPAEKSTAKPAAAPAKPAAAKPEAPQKTVRACQEEWRANRAANEAAGITQKAYVEKCRAGEMATPAPAPAKPAATAPVSAPERPAARTTAPAAPPAPSAAPAARAPTTAGTPTGAGQFASEAQAKARCPGDTVVWVNLDSKIYHFTGYSDYGTTKTGAYMCERDTAAQGFRAAKNEKHP